MSKLTFRQKLETKWSQGKFVCVGLDVDYGKIPQSVHKAQGDLSSDSSSKRFAVISQFIQEIVRSTIDLTACYKPNSAFFERYGELGARLMTFTVDLIHRLDASMPVIDDAKRGDIDSTNNGYVEGILANKETHPYSFNADAITVHPTLGKEAMMPFLNQADKGVIVLARTSNKGAGEFQDLIVPASDLAPSEALFKRVARNVATEWNSVSGNCAVVAGATFPEELGEIRKIVGDMLILIPGVGSQGGDLEKAVRNGANSKGEGFLINVSRSAIYAGSDENYAQATRAYVEDLNKQIAAILAKV